jgi:Trp operon repressor
MTQISKHPLEPSVEKRIHEMFVDSIKNTNEVNEMMDLLNDLLSFTEKTVLAKRLAIAFLLIKGDLDYRQISKTIRVSLGTIAKIHAILALQGNGYRKVINRMLLKQSIKDTLSELGEILTPLPPKGTNIGEWKKARRLSKQRWEKPF